ncbi:MAG TPA: hypothetical protein VIJ20_04080 [Solirubrobacteraceae bacterium]
MAVAQEHQRDLRREAQAANLASSVTPSRPAATTPWYARLSFVWNVRQPARKLGVQASERPSAG